jgi:hypothetical protein
MPDRQQLYDALRKADASGNTADAKQLADYIRTLPAEDPAAAGAAPQMAGLITGAPSTDAKPRVLQPATAAQSALRGGLAYGTRNWGDEIAAGIGAGLYGASKGVRSILPGGVPADAPSVGDVYGQILEGQRTADASARAAHPFIYHGTGIALSALQAPGVAKVGQLGNAARIASLASQGALSGALTGAGSSEGGIADRLASGASGALVGALAAPALDTGVRALGALSSTIQRGAEKAAGFALSRVAGGIQRDVSPAGGIAKFAEAGLEGYERGLIRPTDVLWGSAERQADRVSQLLSSSGQEIEQTLQGAGSVPLQDVKDAIVNATSKLRKTPNLNASKLGEVNKLFEDLDQLSGGTGQIDASQLQVAKEAVDDLVKSWDPGRLVGRADKALERTRQKLYGVLSGQQEDAVAAAAPAALAPYQAAKTSYGLAKTLTGFQESAERRSANQLAGVGGLHGSIGGIAGLMHALTAGDPIGGLAIYAGTRTIASPRVHALAALGAAKAASALPAYAQSVVNPLIARSAAQAIVAALQQSGQP